MHARALTTLLLFAHAGCSSPPVEPDAAADASSPPRDVARDAAGDAAPILDPHVFDCTATGIPARTSTIPLACALDTGCRTPQLAGHRGAGGQLGVLAPEDTLAAYRAGIAIGVEYVETDPRPTADGVIVNIHDTTVDRTTDGTGTVSMMTFEQVRALRIRTTIAGDYACERVPTLTEILRTCRGRVVVLVDANKTDRVDLLVQSILEADAIDWAIFDTSDLGKIDRALAIEPRLRFMIRPQAVGEVTMQLDHFAPRIPTIVELGARELVEGAPIVHARGTRVFTNVFGSDLAANLNGDTSGYGVALDSGADILQTDRPDLAIQVLRARGVR